MQSNLYSNFIVLCGIILVALSIYACYHRQKPGAFLFSIFLSALALYSVGYSLELASLNLPMMLLWNKIEYLGIFTFPTLYLIFVIQYCGHESWLTRRRLILLFAPPAIFLALKLTDDYHHLIYRAVGVNTASPIPLLVFTPGIAYWVYVGYNSLCILTGILLLWRQRRRVSDLFRPELHFMLGMATIPVLVYFFYLLHMFGFQPFPAMNGLDYNPFFYTVWGGCVFWGMFRYRVFDLVPVARKALIESLPDGVVAVDGNFQVVDANPAARHILGWDTPPFHEDIRHVLPGYPDPGASSLSFETSLGSDNQHRFYDVNLSTLKDQRGKMVGQLVVLHDVTRRKEDERELIKAKESAEAASARLREAWTELEVIAGTDKLTGAFNRRKFDEYILMEMDRANRYNTPLSIAILDIDHFKEVNDCFGHDAGDHVLIELVQAVCHDMRKFDLIVRWGGDEFILLTPGATLDQAVSMAERIRESLAGYEFSMASGITVSMGVAQYTAPESHRQLVKRADQALYLAKGNGRNRVEAALLELEPISGVYVS